MSEDNEIPVEPTELDWLDESAEIRVRGSRRALMMVIGLLAVGSSEVPRLRHPMSDGSTEPLMGVVGSSVVDDLNEQFFGDLVDGELSEESVSEKLDPSERFAVREEDVEDLLEVEVLEGVDE